jgi:alpha-amylase/alpha-mannosidase (GH57 family)
MNKARLLVSIFLLLSVLLSACGKGTPSATSPASGETEAPMATETATKEYAEDVLYLNIVWHQHQPLYYKDDDGVYTRPWVRVHATKDYYDMAATVAKYPDVHVTFNLTPVLLKQLNDFVENGAKDRYWVLSEKPAAELTTEEKQFILQRFFDANYDHMIRVHPGYKALLDKRVGGSDAEIAKAMETFTEQDFRDLQVWFNLVWMDPDELAKEPLKALVEKDHGFAEEDKAIVFEQVKKIMAEVVPIHKQLQDAGQIEVITTPYAHPILPLLYNTDLALVGNPNAEMPKQFSYVQDVIAQLKNSVDIYKETYGRDPRGMWPAEGAVAQEIVPLVSNAGYTWMASGEQVLANSLGIGAFTRDSRDTLLEADKLYRPYIVEGPKDGPIKGGPMVMVFRDLLISDKLGFTYSGTPGKEATADFMQRLENIREELKKEGATGPHLVSVILDGENAWENYDNDGKEFLNALYEDLSQSTTVRTVTTSEYMTMFPDQQKLDTLFPGAWFSANYDTWIGEPEETQAWNYLGKVRKFLADYDTLKKKQAPSEEALAQALDYMYLAEGSDWFWWYGADQDSGNDQYFDEGFRALLAKVYESLGEPVPAFVKVPIIPEKVAETTQPFSGLFTPTIDGKAGTDEWAKAAVYPFAGGAQARSEDVAAGVSFGVDAKNLYVKVDAKSDWNSITDAKVGVYVFSPRLKQTNSTSRLSTGKDTPYLLGFGATTLAEVNLADGKGLLYTAATNEWTEGDALTTVKASGTVLEMAIPLTALGEVQAGDELRLAVVISSGERDLQSLPTGGPGQLVLPDLANITYLLDVTDPTGDDKGPGTYTYPTDTVFKPGVFDVTNFKVGVDDKDVIFRFTLAGEIDNPWTGPKGFSVQTLDVYVDKDPGKGTGARLLLPGRNASLTEGNGWDVAIWAESWTPQIVAPDPETLAPKQVSGTDYKIIVDPATKTITLRVPKTVFGEGDPTTWGYAAAVLGQEGYPAAGVWRVRDVSETAEQWRIGGGAKDTNHTRIMDLVWAEGTEPTQETMLSTYPSSQKAVDQLKADDFAQIQLMIP